MTMGFLESTSQTRESSTCSARVESLFDQLHVAAMCDSELECCVTCVLSLPIIPITGTYRYGLDVASRTGGASLPFRGWAMAPRAPTN